VARGKPQERRTTGIHTKVVPLLARRRPAADRSFERLYAKHVHAVYRYSLAVLHNEDDAEDVTQTTFLNAYRAFQRGERPHTPHNWLIKIAHNVCRQRFRDSTRRPREVEFDDSLAAATIESADVPTAPEIRRALREQLGGGLSCSEAQVTLSRLQEKRLSNDERGALRAHLRECKDCATLERRQRAQRAALKHLGTVPLPASLGSFFGSGAAGGVAVGGMSIGAKLATVVAAGLVATGVGHEAMQAIAAKDNAPSSAPRAQYAQPVFSPIMAITKRAKAGRPASRRARKKHHDRAGARTASLRQSAHAAAGGIGSGAATGSPGQNDGGRSPGSGSPLPHLPPAPVQTPQLPIKVPELPPPPVHLPPPPPIPVPPLPPPPPLP